MHELSLMMTVIETVEKYAEENKIDKVESLTLQIGELCSVIPAYVEECFPFAAKGSLLEGADLVIETIAATLKCKACGCEFSDKKNCPSCGGTDLTVMAGREFYIKEIAV